MMSGIFSCTCWPSVCLLWKNVYSAPLTLYNWVVCLFVVALWKFFISDTRLLSNIWLQIFFPFYLFTLLTLSFDVKFLILMKPNWSIFLLLLFVLLMSKLKSTLEVLHLLFPWLQISFPIYHMPCSFTSFKILYK